MKRYTELNEILRDVDNGVEVFWGSLNYRIVKQQFEYFVKSSNHRIGLLDWSGNPNIDLESVFSH